MLTARMLSSQCELSGTLMIFFNHECVRHGLMRSCRGPGLLICEEETSVDATPSTPALRFIMAGPPGCGNAVRHDRSKQPQPPKTDHEATCGLITEIRGLQGNIRFGQSSPGSNGDHICVSDGSIMDVCFGSCVVTEGFMFWLLIHISLKLEQLDCSIALVQMGGTFDPPISWIGKKGNDPDICLGTTFLPASHPHANAILIRMARRR